MGSLKPQLKKFPNLPELCDLEKLKVVFSFPLSTIIFDGNPVKLNCANIYEFLQIFTLFLIVVNFVYYCTFGQEI